mgnify:CR=1 FL=1
MLIRKKKKNYERLTPVSVDTQESDVISLSGKHLGTMENGEFKLDKNGKQKHSGGAVCYCWMVFRKGFKGQPTVGWFN